MYFDFKSSSVVQLLGVNTKIVLLAFETGTNLTKCSNLSVKQAFVSSLIFNSFLASGNFCCLMITFTLKEAKSATMNIL